MPVWVFLSKCSQQVLTEPSYADPHRYAWTLALRHCIILRGFQGAPSQVELAKWLTHDFRKKHGHFSEEDGAENTVATSSQKLSEIKPRNPSFLNPK